MRDPGGAEDILSTYLGIRLVRIVSSVEEEEERRENEKEDKRKEGRIRKRS